jgi:methylglutaconyl-CoA hydratase
MNIPDLKTVLIKQDQDVISIILNRPQKKNALNAQLVSDLKTAFSFAKENKSIKIVILSGAGDSFCSGADLSYLISLKQNTYEENIKDSKILAGLFLMIAQFPKPVIAKVMGSALAGGCGLATVCDFVIAEENAKFGYPEVKIGFVAAIVSAFLIKQIGERKARELLLTGKIFSAKEAFGIGLINRAVPKNELENEINLLLKELRQNSPKAMEVTKELFNSFQYFENAKEVERLAKINAEFRKTDDFFEGINAFLNKKKPNWTTK